MSMFNSLKDTAVSALNNVKDGFGLNDWIYNVKRDMYVSSKLKEKGYTGDRNVPKGLVEVLENEYESALPRTTDKYGQPLDVGDTTYFTSYNSGRDNMFNARNFPVIEGGGDKYPEIKYMSNNIGVVDPNRIMEAMINFRDSGATDLNGRTKTAWYNGTTDEMEDLLTIFGVESASNRTKDGEILNINNVPYNAHAEYNVPGSESYGLMQIDVSGDNKTYVMMAMDPKYRDMLKKEKTVAGRALGNQLLKTIEMKQLNF